MRIRLIKGWFHMEHKIPIGKIVTVAGSLGRKLIEQEIAEEYNGIYPPKKKMKTEFFKPKTK